MSISRPDILILSLAFDDAYLIARLSDGRTVTHPLEWYPRLFKARPDQRANYTLSGGGYGAHWEELDEDLSARGIAQGTPSFEYRPARKA
jgi:hypothetical protein